MTSRATSSLKGKQLSKGLAFSRDKTPWGGRLSTPFKRARRVLSPITILPREGGVRLPSFSFPHISFRFLFCSDTNMQKRGLTVGAQVAPVAVQFHGVL